MKATKKSLYGLAAVGFTAAGFLTGTFAWIGLALVASVAAAFFAVAKA